MSVLGSQAEWEALELTDHQWALESVEEDLMSRELDFDGMFSKELPSGIFWWPAHFYLEPSVWIFWSLQGFVFDPFMLCKVYIHLSVVLVFSHVSPFHNIWKDFKYTGSAAVSCKLEAIALLSHLLDKETFGRNWVYFAYWNALLLACNCMPLGNRIWTT